MKIIYRAEDGKEFEDEWECLDYEWMLNHQHLSDIHIFDEKNQELKDIFSDSTYNNAEKIIVESIEGAHDLVEFAHYTGYASYADIDSNGTWIFDYEKEKFIKKEI